MRFKIGLFLFSFFSLFSLLASDVPYVTCEMKGQLGNQLFQISATLAYAWDYGLEPLFPELNSGHWNLWYNRDKIFFRLNTQSLPRDPQFRFHESDCYQDNPEKPPYHPDHYLHGYFQSWIYFHHHRDKLLEIFSPSEQIEEYLKNKYADLLAYPYTVAVHVRTYNELVHYHGATPFCGLDYYKNAMNLFPQEALFVVFSDRINWCKHHFSKFPHNVVYVEGNDYIQDLFLMAKLKHHIIANSSFSWWGAYLNTNPDQIVIVPRFWLNFRPFPSEDRNTFYLPHWRTIHIDYHKDPYPTDIRQYDHSSKSLDNQ